MGRVDHSLNWRSTDNKFGPVHGRPPKSRQPADGPAGCRGELLRPASDVIISNPWINWRHLARPKKPQSCAEQTEPTCAFPLHKRPQIHWCRMFPRLASSYHASAVSNPISEGPIGQYFAISFQQPVYPQNSLLTPPLIQADCCRPF